MVERGKKIYVYAHWEGMSEAELMGTLSVSESRGKEIFSFAYDEAWLASRERVLLDPGLQFYPGPQYLYDEKPNFGLFTDSSPTGMMQLTRVPGKCLSMNWPDGLEYT